MVKTRLAGTVAVVSVAVAMFGAQASPAVIPGLPEPSASNLHVCSHVRDGLRPWKEHDDEGGFTVWGTWYAYDWWGRGGDCARARFIAGEVVNERGPHTTADVLTTGSPMVPCYASVRNGNVTIEPFAQVFCHVKEKARTKPARQPARDFGVMVIPYPVRIDGWFWDPGRGPCTDPASCAGGPPAGAPQGEPPSVDTTCERRGGALVCRISNNPGQGATMVLTLSRARRVVARKQVVFGTEQVMTLTLRGRVPLQPGAYELHVLITLAGTTVSDATGPLVLSYREHIERRR